MLAWAARLHEIGVMVAHSQYQKHGAYLLRNADLPGFTRQEQTCWRRWCSDIGASFRFRSSLRYPKTFSRCAAMCVILRLAVLLHRGRSVDSKPNPILQVEGENLTLSFPDDWLAGHPLTQLELEQEAERLAAAGMVLRFG
jgi:exopolyphosphatase / guanosine-5'-triphosphate,3'-diphosphate pyrophosphatase